MPEALETLAAPTTIKRPWPPYVAGVNGLLLGPIAGTLVAWLNLRRLGNLVKAQKLLIYAAPAFLVELFILLRLPQSSSRVFGIATTVASYKVFTFVQDPDFKRWKLGNPVEHARNGWSSLGWGIFGAVLAMAFSLGLALLMASFGLLPED